MSEEPQKKIDFKILTADNLLSDKEAAIKKVNIDKRDNLIIENKPEVTNINSLNNNTANVSPPSPLSSSEQQPSNVSFLSKFSSLLSSSRTEKKQEIDQPINIVYDQELTKKQEVDIDKKDSSLFYQPTVKEILKTAASAKSEKIREITASSEEPAVKQSLGYRVLMFFIIILALSSVSFYFLKDNPFVSKLWKGDNSQPIFPTLKFSYFDPSAKTTETTTTITTTANEQDNGLASNKLFTLVTFTSSEQVSTNNIQNLTTSPITTETSTMPLTTPTTPNTSSEQLPVTTTTTIVATTNNNQPTSSAPKEVTEIKNETKPADKVTDIDSLPAAQKLDFTDNFKALPVNLDNNSLDAFAKALKVESAKLKTVGSIYYLDFSINDGQISIKPVLDYFFQPNKAIISLFGKFKNNLSGNFALLFYYSYTRVYPILVLEVKDSAMAKSFMELWEKKGMSNDLQTIFLVNAKLTPLTKDFTKKFYQNIEYKTQNFEKNFVLSWSVVKQYLVIAATDKKIDYLLSILSNY